jgi:hypothetical protein
MPMPGARPAPRVASGPAPGYGRSWWVRTGIALLIVGSGPLAFIIVAAAIGLWPDPNPNPIGSGLPFFFTFLPAVLCIVVRVIRVRRARRAVA